MALKKYLTAFLILLFLSPIIPLVYAGPGDEPIKEHPWEEVKAITHPNVLNAKFVPAVNGVYFFSVSSLRPGFFILVVEKKSQESIKKELSDKTVSLPRKR